MRVLKRLNRALDHLEEWLIATLIAAATLLIFVAVLHRYGTGISINLSKWADAHGVPVVALGAARTSIFGSRRWICPGRRNSASTCSSGWRSSAPPMACGRASMSASTSSSICFLPASRKRVVVFSLLCGALFTGVVAVFGGAFVGEMFQTGQQSNDLEVADVDRISDAAARLRPDVLPFPAGRLVVLLDRPTAAPRRSPCRRHRGRCSCIPPTLPGARSATVKAARSASF